jgi:hypothetical protein
MQNSTPTPTSADQLPQLYAELQTLYSKLREQEAERQALISRFMELSIKTAEEHPERLPEILQMLNAAFPA